MSRNNSYTKVAVTNGLTPYNRALAGYEKAFGPEHTSTLDTVNSLGELYRNEGRLKDAVMMYKRALAGYEKTWGSEHTATLTIANNLGLIYADQDRHIDAEVMYNRALAGYEKALGLEHTSRLADHVCGRIGTDSPRGL